MRLYLLLISSLFLLSNCATPKNTSSKNVLPEILNVYKDSVNAKKFGIAALIKENDKTDTHAIGWAGDSIVMTPDKIFNIGSLTKTFTAVLVMQEIERNNIALTDTIANFFPLYENKNVDPSITIEQLLRHESGLAEVLINKKVDRAVSYPFDDYNYSFLYNKIPEPVSQPGVAYKYCNTNYILLGYILELINDKPYQDLLKERIFDAVNMQNSYAYFSKSFDNIAHPMFNGEDYIDYVFHHYYKNYAFSSGGISSTLYDLEKFFDHLYNKETFLKRETFSMMIDTEGEYGLGIEKYNLNLDGTSIIAYGHSGDNFSYKVRNFYIPEKERLIIIFSNQYKDPYTNKIAGQILRKLK